MSEETKVKEKKESKFAAHLTENKIEFIVAIFLGVTALFTSWAGWIGSLHGGNQATNYTESNNYASMGNSEWNQASQYLMQDMMTWNTISDLMIDLTFAEDKGDADAAEKYSWKIDQIITDNCTPEFAEAVEWALDQAETTGEFVSPFDKEGFEDSYYADAQELLDTADQLLEDGKADNQAGDSFNLVVVIYSITLFLLGIVGIFKNLPNRRIVLVIAIVAFVIATIYMFTLPMPTGFSMSNFFGA